MKGKGLGYLPTASRPWREERGRLPSMGLQRVRQDCTTELLHFHFQYFNWLSVASWGYMSPTILKEKSTKLYGKVQKMANVQCKQQVSIIIVTEIKKKNCVKRYNYNVVIR